MSREDEILALVREVQAGDEGAFERGLVALARRDVEAVMDELRASAFPGASRRVASYEELAALGRRLAAAAGLVAQHERDHPA